MLLNHVTNASIRFNIGWTTKKGISTCFRILFRSPLVGELGESQKQCRRLLTGTSGVLPKVLSTLAARLLTSNHASSASGHLLIKEWTSLQPVRYLNVDRSPIACVTRLVVFEDIQMYKMVHGGVYLSLVEEAGEMAVRKYCSETQPQHVTAVPSLTKIEKTQFLGFATLGDVLEAEAEIIYTAPRALRVLVCLYAAPVVQSKARKLISKSWVWYELLNADKNAEVLPVPPLETKDARLAEEGRLEHETMLADRQSRENVKTASKIEYSGLLANTASTLILDNSSSVFKSFCRVSPALKQMDELAGLTAHLFVQTKCVTGSCDDVNIYSRLVPGSYMTVTTAVVFTSGRTVDVQSFADVETIQDGRTVKERAAEAFFTFVCTKSANQPATIRQFTPQTQFEKEIHERRMKVYQKRKQM